MIILPAHRRLDDVVHHPEAGLDGNIDRSPDDGVGISERDAQTPGANRFAAQCGRHALVQGVDILALEVADPLRGLRVRTAELLIETPSITVILKRLSRNSISVLTTRT